MRFSDLIERQLKMFREDYADVIQACAEAERAYDRAPREEAEERYSRYLDLVETGSEILAEMRDEYRSRLDEATAEAYEDAFNRAVAKRLPRFSLEL